VRVEQKNSDGEYLESIKVVQDKTKESLDRQVKKINETLEVSSRGLVSVILSDIQW
jgi:ribosome maturation factor RimP